MREEKRTDEQTDKNSSFFLKEKREREREREREKLRDGAGAGDSNGEWNGVRGEGRHAGRPRNPHTRGR